MGKTLGLTSFQKTVIITIHKEGKPQKIVLKKLFLNVSLKLVRKIIIHMS